MTIQKTAMTLIRATEIFEDFFGKKPDMTNISDVKEILAIQMDVCYTMQNLETRLEMSNEAVE